MHRKFHLSRRTELFSVQVSMHWNRLPRDGVQSLSLDIFRNCLDEILYYGFQDKTLLEQMTHYDPFPAYPFCERHRETRERVRGRGTSVCAGETGEQSGEGRADAGVRQ